MTIPPFVARDTDDILDTDLAGVKVAYLLEYGREILVELQGGWGRVPGERTKRNYNSQVWLEMTGIPEKIARNYIETLEMWKMRGTELRLLGAPNKMYALMEDENTWMSLPR